MLDDYKLSSLKSTINSLEGSTDRARLYDEIFSLLQTSANYGISLSSIQSRICSFSSNDPDIFSVILKHCLPSILIFSIKAAALLFLKYCLTAGIDTLEVFQVLSVISVLAILSFTIDFYIEYKLSDLQSSITYSVIREGKKVKIPSKDLLVGDIIYISSPQIAPANLILISPEYPYKHENIYICSNSKIITSKTKAIVIDVGKKLYSVKYNERSILMQGETETNAWLEKISGAIFSISFCLVLGIVLIQVIQRKNNKEGCKENDLDKFFHSLLTASYFFAFTGFDFLKKLFNFSFISKRKTMKIDEFDNIRKLSLVCVDIPRIIVSNEINCIYIGNDYSIENEKLRGSPKNVTDLIFNILSVVCFFNKNKDLEGTIKLFELFSANFNDYQKEKPKFELKISFFDNVRNIYIYVIEENSVIKVIAFGSTRGILSLSNYFYRYDGKNEHLSEENKKKILKDFSEKKKQKSIRTFSFAIREITKQEWKTINEEISEIELNSIISELTLVFSISALNSISDAQIRSIQNSIDQGLNIKLVTESNELDSINFAKSAGILPESYNESENKQVITGKDLSIYNNFLLHSPSIAKDNQINQMISKISVLCSAELPQKLLFYSKLEELIANIGIAKKKINRFEKGIKSHFTIEELQDLSKDIKDSKETQETVKGAVFQLLGCYLTVNFLFISFFIIKNSILFEFRYVLNGFWIMCAWWSLLVLFKGIECGGKKRILADFCVNLLMTWLLWWIFRDKSSLESFEIIEILLGIKYLDFSSIEDYFKARFSFTVLKYLIWAAGFRNSRKIWRLQADEKKYLGFVLCLMIAGVDYFNPDCFRFGNNAMCLIAGLLAGVFSYLLETR